MSFFFLLVRDEPDNEHVPARLGLPQGVRVPVVHHVEAAVHVDAEGTLAPPPLGVLAEQLG